MPLCIFQIHFKLISIAASDTTAIALTFALYYITAIPEVWTRLSSEIRSKFISVDEIKGQSVTSLPYLDAVIHECTFNAYIGILRI
jgi:cytochrome P450